MSFLKSITTQAWSFVATQYRASMARRLAPYGLKYHDLLIEFDDVNVAVSRTSPEVLLARQRRMKRAFDLSLKHKSLPYEYQDKNPVDLYLGKHLKIAKNEREERAILNYF